MIHVFLHPLVLAPNLRTHEKKIQVLREVENLVAKIPAVSEIDRIQVPKTYTLFITLQEVPESLGTGHLNSSLQ
jgi:hypothetical protein